jgi:DNA-directed RNA polymerase I subunit RPA2
VISEWKSLGHWPIMVKSDQCNLKDFSPKELVRHHEDVEEFGGYFIINGLEKLIRLLIVPRRNYVMGIIRPSFSKRGPKYTEYGVSIRCVRSDQSSQTITLHYLSNGECTLRFAYRRQEFLIPVVLILKSLIDANDKEIYEQITQRTEDTFVTERVEAMLREFSRYGLYTREQCLAYLGSRFHVILDLPDRFTDIDIGEALIQKFILIHLNSNYEKFNLLVFMVQKLYALVAGHCASDNPDSPMNHEILMAGHLYLIYVKEKIEDWLHNIRMAMIIDSKKSSPPQADVTDPTFFKKYLTKVSSDVGRRLEYFLATGNLVSITGLNLQQTSGYSVIAEKLNFYRYLSHFRSVHRGSFFTELKTTTVRKLLPEAWGFLCPVHTPDGTPCGLLNHLSHLCKIQTRVPYTQNIPKLLKAWGMIEMTRHVTYPSPPLISVLLDGKLIGKCYAEAMIDLSTRLRYEKLKNSITTVTTTTTTTTTIHSVPAELEIACVPPSNKGQYPGLYLFTSPARMLRPVRHLATGNIELISTLEQVYMNIAVKHDDLIEGLTTHIEIAPTSILSVVANLTPLSNFNQSPRNMYQCQMGKQSMGTPTHTWHYRSDNKLYRLQTPQTPAVRPLMHDDYGCDNYPQGINAVVAVISYTGYDMEDAMVINKSSYERGFGHGSLYKTEYIDLGEKKRRKGEPFSRRFGLLDKRTGKSKLDVDGLPFVGMQLKPGDALYSVIDETTGQATVERYKSMEPAYVDAVKLLGDDHHYVDGGGRGEGGGRLQKVSIRLRINRNPVIGDKFSSRHGQKGVLSVFWPATDMPFSESGMVPDIIINPHAFPSRMTIGMLLESMAGKSAALHGICQDATPFKFSEDVSATHYYGEQLKRAGFNYFGNEPMYSGITGKEFKADIYLGIVYYQRLRHMVSDKYQVRTTGPVHHLTMQPVKGRKRAGGIRFGEMERDSLLAHGTSFLLRDRLMNCSDFTQVNILLKKKFFFSL